MNPSLTRRVMIDGFAERYHQTCLATVLKAKTAASAVRLARLGAVELARALHRKSPEVHRQRLSKNRG